MEKAKRLNWIDSIKGIAILGIILTHSGATAVGGWLGLFAANGRRAVQLFFIITSYLALESYERFNAKNSAGVSNTFKWILLRIVRLIPLFYLFTIIHTILGGTPDWLGNGNSVGILNVLSHLSFTNGFFPLFTNSIIGNEWYIAVIAMLYLFIPLFYKFINSLRKSIIWFCLSAFVCWAVYYMAARFLVPHNADEYIYNSFFVNFNIVAQLPAILLGVVLYHVIKKDAATKIKNAKLLSYVILVVSVIGIAAIFKLQFVYISEYAVWGLFLFGICFSQYLHSCALIDNPLFRTLGKNSYAMYLSHMFIKILYEKNMPAIIENEIPSMLAKYAIIVCVTVAVSIPLTKYFEKPLTAKIVGRKSANQ